MYHNPEIEKLTKYEPFGLYFKVIMELMLNNKIWFTRDVAQFSLIPLEGYLNYDHLMANDFKGYKLNEKL